MDRLKARLVEEAHLRRTQLEDGMCHDYTSYKIVSSELYLLKEIIGIIDEYENQDDLGVDEFDEEAA